MATYFDVIPSDLRRSILLNLPYDGVIEYRLSQNFNVGPEDRFWIEYISLNYFIDPEEYLENYTSYNMAKWIDEVLREFFKRKSAVNVYSLKFMLKEFKNPKSLTREDVLNRGGLYLKGNEYRTPKPKSKMKIGDLILLYIFNCWEPENGSLLSISRGDSIEINLPFSWGEFKIIYNKLLEMNPENMNLNSFASDPVLGPFISYIASLARKKTPYFVPGGIKYVNFNTEVTEDPDFMINGENIYWDYDSVHLNEIMSGLFAPEIKAIYDEEIIPFFE